MISKLSVLERATFLWPWFPSLRLGFRFHLWCFGCVPFSSHKRQHSSEAAGSNLSLILTAKNKDEFTNRIKNSCLGYTYKYWYWYTIHHADIAHLNDPELLSCATDVMTQYITHRLRSDNSVSERSKSPSNANRVMGPTSYGGAPLDNDNDQTGNRTLDLGQQRQIQKSIGPIQRGADWELGGGKGPL